MRKVSVLLVVALMCTVFAGCGPKIDTAGVAEPAAAEPVAAEAETQNVEVAPADDDSLVSKYPNFTVTSENLNNGVWDDVISNTDKGQNQSPQLSWDPVDGAEMYFIYMVDTSMQDWIHWKSDYVTETNLPLGFAGESEYVGPYPPAGGCHNYEIYVVALKKPTKRIKGSLNGQNMKFAEFIDAADTDEDGNTGNIVAGAHLVGTFTN